MNKIKKFIKIISTFFQKIRKWNNILRDLFSNFCQKIKSGDNNSEIFFTFYGILTFESPNGNTNSIKYENRPPIFFRLHFCDFFFSCPKQGQTGRVQYKWGNYLPPGGSVDQWGKCLPRYRPKWVGFPGTTQWN